MKFLANWMKLLYKLKIRTMFYFGLGYSEVSGIIGMVKDIAIVLGFAVLVLKIHLNIVPFVIICFISFLLFIAIGMTLKKSGMSDFATKMSNSINPELKLIRRIAKHLGVDDNNE